MSEVCLPYLKLSEAPTAHEGRIHSFCGDQEINRRLREMGFFEGASIRLVSRMPFGGPILVDVDQFSIALRREEASAILLESL